MGYNLDYSVIITSIYDNKELTLIENRKRCTRTHTDWKHTLVGSTKLATDYFGSMMHSSVDDNEDK